MIGMKSNVSQAYLTDKLLKIGRNLAWMGAVMFAGLAVGLEIFRQLRRVAYKRRDGETDDERGRSGHTLR